LKYNDLLVPYNTWWTDISSAFSRLPLFHRPVFNDILYGLRETQQIISITGPRRVGKSTLIKQIAKQLISEGISPEKIIYYSMDDPALYRADVDHDGFFDSLMEEARTRAGSGPMYIFLDEVQRFERWELFLKKYYDLHYPVRFVISGSASSPIFKKSRESLLGRIKDYHLLPFSFREFLLYQTRENDGTTEQLHEIYKTGDAIRGMMSKHPEFAERSNIIVPPVPEDLHSIIDRYLADYFIQGGFPEVWSLPDWQLKQSYLFDNQVEKVISEDLVLAVELRKPELMKRFYISLLENPGCEINLTKLSQSLEISRPNIEKYFPLLEMTDLIHHAEKFNKGALKVRRGNIKCYLIDLALRNAVLRIHDTLLQDSQMLGLYAENLVFNALKKWEGTVGISYFREKQSEVDFIVHTASKTYYPIEVKYKETIEVRDARNIVNFGARFKCPDGIIVSKRWEDFGRRDKQPSPFFIPLPHFLLLFD